MSKRYCDLCGKEIKANEDYAEVKADIVHNALTHETFKGARNIYNNELCADCYIAFYEMYNDLREKKGI